MDSTALSSESNRSPFVVLQPILRLTSRSREPELTYLVASLLVLLACALHAVWIGTPVFPLDDAYITVHNAQVLTGMPETNFIGTPALAGSTSIAHTLLVSFFMYLLDPLWAALIAQYATVLLYALAVVHILRVHGLRIYEGCAVLMLALLVGHPFYQLLNGLETALAMAATTFALSMASEGKSLRLLAAVCGLLPFLRPELAALSALLLVSVGARRLRPAFGTQSTWRLTLDLLTCACVALPFLTLLYWNTGSILPNTISAKQYYFAESTFPPIMRYAWTRGTILKFIYVIGPVAGATLFLVRNWMGILSSIFIPTFAFAYYSRFPRALIHYQYRYLYLLFPLVLFGLCMGLVDKDKYVRGAAYGLLGITLLQHVVSIPSSWRSYVGSCYFTRHQLENVVDFCNRSINPSSRLLIHDAGYISFGTKLSLVDLVGLKTPLAAAFHRTYTYPSGGRYRAQAIAKTAEATNPDYLVVLNGWDKIFRISEGLKKEGWTLERVWGDITPTEELPPSNPEYISHYVIYRLTNPKNANHPASFVSHGERRQGL